MKLIKREKRITIPQFCGIFTKREFTIRDKLFKSIYFVEDEVGDYRIEERMTVLALAFFLVVSPLLLLYTLIVYGLHGLYETYNDHDGFINYTKPLRVDECKHNIKSTAQLLELTGWS